MKSQMTEVNIREEKNNQASKQTNKNKEKNR